MLGEVFTQLQIELLIKLTLAVLFGGLIGLEREFSNHPAGLRTNILICVGATLLMELSIRVGVEPGNDPGRIAAQVVSGIGFLGAGSIIRSRGSVRGLTTAATIWVVAAIGLAIGAAQYLAAAGSTVLVLVVLSVLGTIERRYLRERYGFVLSLHATRNFRFSHIAGAVRDMGFSVRMRRITEHPDHRIIRLRVVGPRSRLLELREALLRDPDIVSVRH